MRQQHPLECGRVTHPDIPTTDFQPELKRAISWTDAYSSAKEFATICVDVLRNDGVSVLIAHLTTHRDRLRIVFAIGKRKKLNRYSEFTLQLRLCACDLFPRCRLPDASEMWMGNTVRA